MSSSSSSTSFLNQLSHSSAITSQQAREFLKFVEEHKHLNHKRQEFSWGIVSAEEDSGNAVEAGDAAESTANNASLTSNDTSAAASDPQQHRFHLYDCKIFCRGPDDRIYLSRTIPHHENIRKWMTRGCILVHHQKDDEWHMFQGYGKFTGFTEEDDDDLSRNQEDPKQQQKKDSSQNKNQQDIDSEDTPFFHGKYTDAHAMIRVEKENGKAAHFAVFKHGEDFVYVAGSKNVHILFRNREDIRKVEQKSTSRMPLLHCRIAHLVLDILEKMPEDKKKEFLTTLSTCGLMMNFELMLKEEQHVVDYKLTDHELRFLAFTPRTYENDEVYDEVGKCLPLVASMEWVKSFGFKTAHYEEQSFSKENLQKMIADIRKTPNSEGSVIYFVNAKSRTLGLWKVKSEWYIILRAIREKVVNMYVDFNARMASRMRQLQNRLSLSDEEMWKWNVYADALHKFIKKKILDGQIDESTQAIRDNFATLLTEFNSEYKHPENIEEAHGELKMEDESPLSMAKQSKKKRKRNDKQQWKNKKKQKKEPNPKSEATQSKKTEKKQGGFQLHYLNNK